MTLHDFFISKMVLNKEKKDKVTKRDSELDKG